MSVIRESDFAWTLEVIEIHIANNLDLKQTKTRAKRQCVMTTDEETETLFYKTVCDKKNL